VSAARSESIPADPFGALVPAGAPDIAVDRAHRETCQPDSPPFIAAGRAGLSVRILELVRAEGRLLAQLAASGSAHPSAPPQRSDEPSADLPTGTLAGTSAGTSIGPLPGAELFVQRGTLTLDGDVLHAGTWLRQPLHGPVACAHAGLSADALVLVSIGQIAPDDAEQRRHDTADSEAWMAGPNEGIEVLPLHGQGNANVMLMRWSGTVAFRPTLDPVGDEVFVLSGELHDSHGSFGAGSWIRNPVPAWQSWAGTPGTLVCYKSGHFTAVPDDDFLRATC